MKNSVEPLLPRFKGQMIKSKPSGLTEIILKEAEREMLERQSLSIFTECSNSGLPFRDCLVAILITGMDWGIQITKGK